MAEEEETDELLDEDITEGLEKKRLSGKMIVLIAAGAIVVLLAGVGAFFLLGDDETPQEADNEKASEPKNLAFVDLPEIVVNLNTTGPQSVFLKVNVALEVDRSSAEDAIEEKMPRVIDQFQVYLRELRLEDLNGSAGMFRLKEELLLRVNQAIAPAQVKDVLFREMVVQ